MSSTLVFQTHRKKLAYCFDESNVPKITQSMSMYTFGTQDSQFLHRCVLKGVCFVVLRNQLAYYCAPTEHFGTCSHQHLGIMTLWHTAVLVGNYSWIVIRHVLEHVNRPSFGVLFLQFNYYIDTCKYTVILALNLMVNTRYTILFWECKPLSARNCQQARPPCYKAFLMLFQTV